MLVNVYHDSPREHRRLLVAGVAFLTVIALLIALSIAIYNKTFARVTTITIEADRAGLQLAKFGDVRVNGALVGQVRTVAQSGDHAEIKVALDRWRFEQSKEGKDWRTSVRNQSLAVTNLYRAVNTIPRAPSKEERDAMAFLAAEQAKALMSLLRKQLP